MSYNRYRPNSFPPVVKNLIIINVLFFVAQIVFENSFHLTQKIALWPVPSSQFRPYQIFTHMFSHSPNLWLHILFNMYGLWLFGSQLENFWGPKRFLFFYLACGIGAAVAHMTMTYFQYENAYEVAEKILATDGQTEAINYLRTNLPGYAVGASGAVMGVLVGFAYLFPNTEMMIIPIPIPIKAKWLVIAYVAYDLIGGLRAAEGDSIAHFAHLGGALTGFLLVLFWNRTNKKTFY